EIRLAVGGPDHRPGQVDPDQLTVPAYQAPVRLDLVRRAGRARRSGLTGRAGQGAGDQGLERGLVGWEERTQQVRPGEFRPRVAGQLAVRVVNRETGPTPARAEAGR